MRYLPHTQEEIQEMLETIGISSLEDLFRSLPAEAKLKGALDLPESLSEPELMAHLIELGKKNRGADMLSFIGAGSYAHHIPPAVDQLLLRSEFYTAYTPYQPEVAQGTLQAIWEFQTIVSEIYGLPLANASMYDGASAVAEAVLMALRLSKRGKVLISEALHPQYLETIRTLLASREDVSIEFLPLDASGQTDQKHFNSVLNDEVACVLLQSPNFFGRVEDLRPFSAAAEAIGALSVCANSEPYAFAVTASPGEQGIDISAGEGQALAVPVQFGGPGVGLFASKHDRKTLQQLPGRLCGETVDSSGERGFVLTLSTREQHIRRERATSNICTNQGLVALSMLIRSCLLGKEGFIEVAKQCAAKARYLRSELLKLDGVSDIFSEEAPFFNEFAIQFNNKSAAQILRALEAEGIVGGYDLGLEDKARASQLLLCATELHTRAQLDRLIAAISRSISN